HYIYHISLHDALPIYQSQMIGEARQMIEKLEEVIKKVTSPANRIGTFLGAISKDTAHIVVGGSDYYCNVDPRIPLAKLKKGTRVDRKSTRLNSSHRTI